MEIGRKHNKSVQEYRHNIKLLKYHLKKEQRINETLKYKAIKNDKKQKSQVKKKDTKPVQKIYSMLETVSKLSQRMKIMGLNLCDIFRMADSQYEGQINRGQFLKVVNQLKAQLDENLIQELFYAIDTNMNGILDENEYLEFLCAYGGADSKDAIRFQRKSLEKFSAQLKKKSIKSQQFLADSMDPISVYDFKKKLQPLSLNENQKMILLKAFDPENSGHISHEFFIQQTKTIKQKTEQAIKNQELEKDIKHMCAKWRDNKINPIKIFQEADVDSKDGISPAELEDAFIRLMPEETKFTIKKWVKLINFNNDNEITREEFTNSIRSFYALNQLEKFSADYEKQNPNARRGIKNEEVPAESILKKLGQKIIVEKMTNKQAFKSMDINGDGTLNKGELAEGLKKLGFHIVDVGKILSVFDRDVSEGIDVTEWCKILGEDVQFQEVSSDQDSKSDTSDKPKKAPKEVLKNNNAEIKKGDAKAQEKPKKPEPKKGENTKNPESVRKNDQQKKPETGKKADSSVSKVDQSKNKTTDKKGTEKSLETSKTKPVQKDMSISKPKPKEESPVKPPGRKVEQKKPIEPIKKSSKAPIKPAKKPQSQPEEPQQEQKEVDISEIQRQVGIEFKKHPNKVLSIFKKFNIKGKTHISLKDLKTALGELKVSVDEDQIKKIFQENIEAGAYMNYKDWLEKTADEHAQDVEEEKEKQPEKVEDTKLKIKKTQSKMESSKDLKKETKPEKPKKVEEKVEQNQSDIPNQSDLKSLRSIRSVTSNNPRQEVVAERLSKCIESPEELTKLEKQYLSKANQLKKSKKKFQDKAFPADMSSITKNTKDSKIDLTGIKWKHYSEFVKQPQLFQEGIDPNDILQGGLGNCYFLSALACLAEYPNLIQRLFEYSDIDAGYFLVWLCIDGVWKLYQLDGNIVVDPTGTGPRFTKSKQGELWVVLLQKAYAKAYGCYEHIVGGDSGNAIRDLTGSPSKYFQHSKVKQEELWQQLYEANQKKFIMSAGTDVSKGPEIKKIEGRQENVTAQGLVLGHAYSILDIREEGKDKIIQLRNPWGGMEWTGDWSDGSKKWTKQMKEKLNYQGGEDGIFWMPFKDFFMRYKSTGINSLRADYFYQSQTQPKAKNLLVKVSHYELKELFMGICQKDKRHKGKANPAEQYTPVSFVSLICEEGDDIKVLKKVHDTTWIDTKEVQIEFGGLQENQQIVLLIKVPKQTDLTISAYANCQTDFNVSELSNQEDTNYSEGVAFLAEKEDADEAQGFKFWTAWVGQRAFFCVKNVSSSKNKFSLKFENPVNMEFLSGSKNAGQYVLDIKKGETKSIKAQIKDKSKASGFGSFSF